MPAKRGNPKKVVKDNIKERSENLSSTYTFLSNELFFAKRRRRAAEQAATTAERRARHGSGTASTGRRRHIVWHQKQHRQAKPDKRKEWT